MTITSLHISCTTGANRRPNAGWAVFSDGKGYDWMVHPIDGDIVFHTDRGPKGCRTLVSFRSAKRAAAISAALGL